MKLEKRYYLRSLVSSGDLHYTVGVDLERNLNLRNATRSRRDARKLKFAKQIVILGQRTLPLKDLNKDGRLVVSSGGEYLTLAGRNNSVASNELGEDTASGLDPERKRADVNENNVLRSLFAGENTSLDGSSVGDSLIGVDSLGGLFAKVVFEQLLNLGNTR